MLINSIVFFIMIMMI